MNKKPSSENRSEEVHLENVSVDGRLLLKWILKKYGVRMETGLIWLRTRPSGGLL
jgi:hypothetical protein